MKKVVNKGIRSKIHWFIYAYETLNEKEIASNLPNVDLKDIREVLLNDFAG